MPRTRRKTSVDRNFHTRFRAYHAQPREGQAAGPSMASAVPPEREEEERRSKTRAAADKQAACHPQRAAGGATSAPFPFRRLPSPGGRRRASRRAWTANRAISRARAPNGAVPLGSHNPALRHGEGRRTETKCRLSPGGRQADDDAPLPGVRRCSGIQSAQNGAGRPPRQRGNQRCGRIAATATARAATTVLLGAVPAPGGESGQTTARRTAVRVAANYRRLRAAENDGADFPAAAEAGRRGRRCLGCSSVRRVRAARMSQPRSERTGRDATHAVRRKSTAAAGQDREKEPTLPFPHPPPPLGANKDDPGGKEVPELFPKGGGTLEGLCARKKKNNQPGIYNNDSSSEKTRIHDKGTQCVRYRHMRRRTSSFPSTQQRTTYESAGRQAGRAARGRANER
ncbi:hypothetical protein HPB48_020533 [Haemaphysalis longicornis]|uniref:Uncharacterized protein n=1 Tax=Haemaphysalis longicornis TaxID=44386 RepID=A0A9J6G5Y2_HAELO|nr:hypothetical protein HPB48_020533 [Haemaphysalis longicornis]